MKQALIRFLLRLLGVHVGPVPKLPVYVIIAEGERVADVTTNRFRALTIAKEQTLKGVNTDVWRYAPDRIERS